MTLRSTRITFAVTLAALIGGTAIASAQTYRDPNYYYGNGMRRDVPPPAYPGTYYSPYGYDGMGNPSAGHGAVNPGSLNSGPDTAG